MIDIDRADAEGATITFKLAGVGALTGTYVRAEGRSYVEIDVYGDDLPNDLNGPHLVTLRDIEAVEYGA